MRVFFFTEICPRKISLVHDRPNDGPFFAFDQKMTFKNLVPQFKKLSIRVPTSKKTALNWTKQVKALENGKNRMIGLPQNMEERTKTSGATAEGSKSYLM